MRALGPASLDDAAKDLVLRARDGDQNAMGLIAEVRAQARAGSARARASQAALMAYVRAHPVQESDIGAEARTHVRKIAKLGPMIAYVSLLRLPAFGPEAALAGAVTLANGPRLSGERVHDMGLLMDERDQRPFFLGVTTCCCDAKRHASRLPPRAACAVMAGQCVQIAFNLQRVRAPGTSISRFSPMAGWELGE